MGLDRKLDAVARLGADVLVVLECARENALAHGRDVSFAWRGDAPRKGLAVFGFGGWSVVPVAEDAPLPWALPVDVLDPAGERQLTLVAVWTGRPRFDGRPTYWGQVTAVVERWADGLANGDVVLAGDFNCSATGPYARPHLANVARLAALDVHSAYHAHHGLAHGEETAMTLRWVGPGRHARVYHCDFVFLPRRLLGRLESVELADLDELAAARLSDHAPIVVALGPGIPETE